MEEFHSSYAHWPSCIGLASLVPTPSSASTSRMSAEKALAAASAMYNPKDVVPFDQLIHTGTPKDLSKKYVCPLCPREFLNKTDFRRHYMIHTGEKPHACPHCPERFQRLEKLKHHVFLNHRQ